MAGPNIQLLNYILELYTYYDKKQEETEVVVEPTKNHDPIVLIRKIGFLAERFTNYLTGNDRVNAALVNFCNQIWAKINGPDSAEINWIEVIYFLGNLAPQAQALKRMDGPSRCCEIIHCLRNVIVNALKNDKVQNEKGQYYKQYTTEVATLKRALENLRTRIISLQGQDAESSVNDNINEIYLKLAFLEDPDAIYEATQRNLLSYLYSVKEREKFFKSEENITTKIDGKPIFPYAFQPHFFKIHYEIRYRLKTGTSLENFMISGIPKQTPTYPAEKISEQDRKTPASPSI